MNEQKKSCEILDRIYSTIKSRNGDRTDLSYTAELFSLGRSEIARKLGEEAVETIISYLDKNSKNVVNESADLIYHLLVLWADQGIEPRQVWTELSRREGMSGIVEKNNRNKKR